MQNVYEEMLKTALIMDDAVAGIQKVASANNDSIDYHYEGMIKSAALMVDAVEGLERMATASDDEVKKELARRDYEARKQSIDANYGAGRKTVGLASALGTGYGVSKARKGGKLGLLGTGAALAAGGAGHAASTLATRKSKKRALEKAKDVTIRDNELGIYNP